MIKEIKAITLLSSLTNPDPWFGLKYNMNLYRGCQHQCIYCDSRSECYQIENFADILVKVNAIELLATELKRKRVKGIIGTGSMNDPYMPLEADRCLMQRALEVIADYRFPVHIITKSDLVVRDLEILKQINQIYATVSFSITTYDDDLGKKLEPGAPLVSDRFKAMKLLSEHGISTGVTLMPVLPFLEDHEENITAIVEKAREAGARYIIPSFGMSLRDRQREYYYTQLDHLFPGVRKQYEQRYGVMYQCPSPQTKALELLFTELQQKYGFERSIPPYLSNTMKQLELF